VFLAPVSSSLGWLSGGAALVEITAPTTVPLVHEVGDPRPRQVVQVGTREVQAIVDLGGRHSRVGELWAIRLGLQTRRRRGTEVVTLPEVRFGEVVLHDLRAEVVDDDIFALGAGALTELAVAVRPSRGEVSWVRAGDAEALLAEVGPAREGDPTWSTRQLRSVAPGPGAWRDGRHRVWVTPTIDGHPLRPLWAAVGADDASPSPSWGADALVQLDVAVAPARDRWAAAPHGIVVPDLVADQRRRSEVEAEGWELPATTGPEATSTEAGDAGSGWRSERWAELADLRWADDDPHGAIEAATAAVGWGADRCEPWVALGELLLRTGVRPSGGVRGVDRRPVAVLSHARGLLAAWEEQHPAKRGHQGFAVRQPATCRRVHGLLAEAHLAAARAGDSAAAERLEQLDHPDALVPRAVAAVHEGRLHAALAHLLHHVAERPDPAPLRDAWLGWVQAHLDRGWVAAEAVCGGPDEGLALAALRGRIAARIAEDDNGVELMRACGPGAPGRGVVRRIHGDDGAELPGAVSVARRPGQAPVLAAAALASELYGGPAIPAAPPGPDRLVARLLVAQADTRPEAVARAAAELASRWPLWSVPERSGKAGVSYSAFGGAP